MSLAENHEIEISAFTKGDEAGVLDVILSIQQKEFGILITADDQPASFPAMAMDSKFYALNVSST